MKIKRNLFFLFVITIFSLISVVLCVSNYNPFNIGLAQFIYFYSSILFTVWGIVSIILFAIKIKLSHKETIYVHFWPAVRQGMIFSLGITTLLILRGLKLLDIWVGIPIMIIIILIELFFQTKNVSRKSSASKMSS